MMTTKKNTGLIKQLKQIYKISKNEIVSRLKEFEMCRTKMNDEEIFSELTFCLLTPQSKAKSCWNAIETIRNEDLLLNGTVEQIKKKLHSVRFHNKKAQYIADARKLFMHNSRIVIKPFLEEFTDIHECREWLVKNIKGLGYKEAGHFLRNVGLGENIAILDRHILRNLEMLGVIGKIPTSLSRAKYMQIEKDMADFAKQINIPLDHLDLLFWSKETGEIFK
jgi:N-glycosylase/DNA lyase